MSFISLVSLFLRPILVAVVVVVVVFVVVEMPVDGVTVETISVSRETCMLDYFKHV